MNIVTTCGMGFGTSLMLLMEIQAIGRRHGIEVRGEAVDMSSVKGIPCDAIFGSAEIVRELRDMQVPVIGITNILDKQEIERKFLEFVATSNRSSDQE